MTTMTAYPAAVQSYVPTYGSPEPYPPNGPPPPQRPSWVKYIALGLGGVALIAATALTTLGISNVTRQTNPTQATSTQTTVEPPAQIFNTRDIGWCREYQLQAEKVADQRKTLGWPRDVTARDVRASDWTPDEAKANRDFARYLALLTDETMQGLRNRAENPAIRTLINTAMVSTNSLAQVIRDGTYVPTDYSLLRTSAASSIALDDICQEIVRG